jgi:hypothetical protein
VPIVGRTPHECFEHFREHLAKLLGQTVKTRIPILAHEVGGAAHVGFRQGEEPVTVPIETNCGRLYLWIAQQVQTELHEAKHVLRTTKYWYRLQAKAGGDEKALIRWEFDRTLTGGRKPPRHHVQQDATIKISERLYFDLDKLHLPTGWVTIEEVLRFLIHDLGMKPPCGSGWPKVIEDSEAVFREQFSTRN